MVGEGDDFCVVYWVVVIVVGILVCCVVGFGDGVCVVEGVI